MPVGVLWLHLHIPAAHSLKEKRRAVKSLLDRLQREFNVSVAEMDAQDVHTEAVVACAHISNSAAHTQRTLQRVVRWVESHWHYGYIADESIEML